MRYAPDLTGTGPLVTQLAEDLKSAGDRVTVVTSVPHYGQREVPAKYRGRALVEEELDGIRLIRTTAILFAPGSRLGRALDYVAYTLFALWGGMRVREIDVILAVAPPITVALPAAILGRIRGVPMVFNAQDIWPDGLIEMGKLREGPWLLPLRLFEKWAYKTASRISVVSQGMKDRLKGRSVPDDRIEVIPNWIDTERIKPSRATDSFRREHDLGDKFVLMFAGNIGFAAGLEQLIRAASLLQKNEGIHFVIVGEGSAKAGLRRMARDLSLANLTFLPTQPSKTVAAMLCSADVGLVTLRRGMGELSVPSKTFAYMASALPVLAAVPDDSEIARVVEHSQCGLVVAAEDPKELAEAALEFSRMEASRRQAMGEAARAHVEKHFARSKLVAKHRNLLLSVAKPGDPLAGGNQRQREG